MCSTFTWKKKIQGHIRDRETDRGAARDGVNMAILKSNNAMFLEKNACSHNAYEWKFPPVIGHSALIFFQL